MSILVKLSQNVEWLIDQLMYLLSAIYGYLGDVPQSAICIC